MKVSKFKQSVILTSVTLAFSVHSFAATPLNAAPSQTAESSLKSTSSPKAMQASADLTPPSSQKAQAFDGPPLNQYGAVDVNAKVPVALQVPEAPADFTPPKVTPLTQIWSQYIPSAPQFNVKSYVLMAAHTGQIIASFKPNLRVAPASLTKLMLLYITMHELQNGVIHLTDQVRVPKVAWATGGSRMFLKPGSMVSVRDLISGVIVDSGNDAAVTLATYIAGTQNGFVSMMNHEAQQLGMSNTHFTDVMGLPAPNHYSSARDMGVLAYAIVSQFPQYLDWFNQKYFTYNNIKQSNFNKLLFIYPYADGLKTGSTDAAGFSLISTAKMPNQPMRLIGVMMGAPSNMQTAEFSKSLLTYGFRFFKTEEFYEANQPIKQVRVYKGSDKFVNIGPSQDVYITLPIGNNIQLSAEVNVDKTVKAPVKQGEPLGTLIVKANNQVVYQGPLVALKDDPLGNWWQRTTDTVSSWF